jgi:hypothetical protein
MLLSGRFKACPVDFGLLSFDGGLARMSAGKR